MRIDLHTHSNISDGTQDPAKLMDAARAADLDVVALTDHDLAAGWPEASKRARQIGLTLVPGIEISCRAGGLAVHLLAYLPDPADEALSRELTQIRSGRIERAKEMVSRISRDYPIDWSSVERHTLPGISVGRPHIADALVAAGVISNRSEAFTSILAPGGPYYLKHYAPKVTTMIALVRNAGGVPVFAHPGASGRGRVVDDATIGKMVDAGLAGLEVYHRDNPEDQRERLLALADRYHLVVTGSSDYHGLGKPNRLGENTTAPEALEAIEELGSGTKVIRP